MTPEQRAAELVDLKRRVAELEAGDNLPSAEMPCEVTVVIPVFNAFMTLGRVLYGLVHGAQSVPIKVVLCDNGSRDPCSDVLAGPRLGEWLAAGGVVETRVLDAVPHKVVDPTTGAAMSPQEAINKNLEHLWRKLTLSVDPKDTPFILYVDADVVPPVGAARDMLELMKADEKLGMVGVLYDPRADHVQMGCTMARAEVMRKVDWRSDGCPCRWLCKHLLAGGWKVEHLDPSRITARHLKLEA